MKQMLIMPKLQLTLQKILNSQQNYSINEQLSMLYHLLTRSRPSSDYLFSFRQIQNRILDLYGSIHYTEVIIRICLRSMMNRVLVFIDRMQQQPMIIIQQH